MTYKPHHSTFQEEFEIYIKKPYPYPVLFVSHRVEGVNEAFPLVFPTYMALCIVHMHTEVNSILHAKP
jgi:hypothetical protein